MPFIESVTNVENDKVRLINIKWKFVCTQPSNQTACNFLHW